MRPENQAQAHRGPCCIPQDPGLLVYDGFAVERLTPDDYGDPLSQAVGVDQFPDGCGFPEGVLGAGVHAPNKGGLGGEP